MLQTPPPRAWFSRGWIAVPIVALATTLLPGVVAASPTQSVGDLQKQAAQIASQLDSLNNKSSMLDEQYNETEIKLQSLNSQLGTLRQAVTQAQADLDKHRSTAKKYAVDAYMTGGRVDDLVDPGNDNASISRRRIYLSAVNGDRQTVIAQVTNSEQDLHQSEAALKSKTDAIATQKSDLDKSRSELRSTINQQQQLQASVTGQLATAVAAEQARRAAAAAAAAQAAEQAAAQAAARQAAAPAHSNSPTGHGSAARTVTVGGTGGGTGHATSPSSGPSLPTGNFPVPSALPAGAAGAIAAARSQLGVPYHWAMASPGVGFDCSGLVMWAYSQVGISLPHSSSAMYAMTQRISYSQLQPGDLVFNGSPVHHVGIYVGGGMMINAPHTGANVEYDPIGYAGVVSFGRI
jgi:cell wall-associated NlpC family hydrolase